jgi:nucleoside-diphosphate-sugar epimerase
MRQLLIFGMGYTATRLATQLRADGWQVTGTSREGRAGTVSWGSPEIPVLMTKATHILSSVPPDGGGPLHDPVLRLYHDRLCDWQGRWLGYLSTTGVYGDTGGAWVDETASTLPAKKNGRQTNRTLSDRHWLDLSSRARAPVRVFRLPGIYGPGGRSALDRVREGRANRIDLAASGKKDHVFSRIHVDDIVETLVRSLNAPARCGPEIFNVTDDEPASGNAVIEYACDLLGVAYPPLKNLDDPAISAMARSFYADCRRVKNDKIKRVLGVKLRYPTYREGLAACLKETHP